MITQKIELAEHDGELWSIHYNYKEESTWKHELYTDLTFDKVIDYIINGTPV